MSCACIKGNFDIFFKKINEENSVILDASIWMDGERYSGEKAYTLEIKNIINGNTYSHDIEVEAKNVIHKDDFAFDDGIYLFSLMNCGNPYSKYGLSLFCINEVFEELVIKHYDDMKEVITDFWLKMVLLETKVNRYETEQNEPELIESFNELQEFANEIKCKI